MKINIKEAARVLIDYLIVLVIFVVFLYSFMSITGESFIEWVPLYSFFMFLVLFLIVYSDFRGMAIKDKKPQYQLDPYPLKGLLLGLLGFLPIVLITAIYPLITLDSETANNIKRLALHTILGPLFFIVKLGGKTVFAYAMALIMIPVLSMLGYLAGFYGFSMRTLFGKNKAVDKKTEQKPFKKSPWNPTANVEKEKGKKKGRKL